VKEILFVMFFASVGGRPHVTATITAEFANKESCVSSSEGFIKIANAKKVEVMVMCSPKELDGKRSPARFEQRAAKAQ
jgi:hypothetical protein